MKTKKEEFIDSLINGSLLDNIYGYAYKRCFSKEEAEELCQDIITEILYALSINDEVTNLNAYIWQIANNTLINNINKNKRVNNNYSFEDNLINVVDLGSMEDNIIERIVNRDKLDVIKQQISSLSKLYRDVMVMFYLDELPISAIAERLNIPENRVKQRLHTARTKIRKGVTYMSTSKPESKLYDLQLANLGGIGLFEYDPRNKISSSLLRKNIVISCQKKAKSIKELSDEFNVQFRILKDEIVQIPDDFLIKKVDGKYIANSIVVDIKTQEKFEKLTASVKT